MAFLNGYCDFDSLITWLLQNQEYYDKISGICQMTCEDCKGKTIPYAASDKCIRNIYKKESLFYEYYRTMVLLLELRNISDNCEPFVSDYHLIPQEDIKAIDCWCIKALEFSDNSFQNYHIDNNIVYNHNKECIGIRPNFSVLYKENPFILSIEGFENLIEFQEIMNKEFTIERTPVFSLPANN